MNFRIQRVASLIGVLASLATSVATAQTFDFNRYSVPVWQGARAAPDFSGPASQFAMFRTAIRTGFAKAPLAGGHFAVIAVGCGMQCITYYFGDVKTGGVLKFPIAGEPYPALQLVTVPDSRLVVAKWGDPFANQCTVRKYLIVGTEFARVGGDMQLRSGCDNF